MNKHRQLSMAVLVFLSLGMGLISACQSSSSSGDAGANPNSGITGTNAGSTPTIIAVSPVNNTTEVPVAATISATFSQAMDSTTLTAATFSVLGPGGGVDGGVLASGATATFTPSSQLIYGSTYTVTITTGAKDPAGTSLAADYTWSFIAQTPIVRFVYVSNVNDNTLSIYSADLGGRRLRHNGYVSTGSTPRAVVSDPRGKFLYVANSGAASISAFRVNGVNGSLTQIDADAVTAGVQNFAAGTLPMVLAMHPSGKFLYAANNGSNSIAAYTVDGTTGELVPIDTDTATAGVQYYPSTAPIGLSLHPSGKFLYVLDNAAFSISAFAIDLATGRLTAIDADAVTTGTQALQISAANTTALAMDALGQYLYAMDSNPVTGNIHALRIDPQSGALTLTSSQYSVSGPTAAAIHPSGNFAFVANYPGASDTASSGATAFTLSRSNGALSYVNSITTTPLHASSIVSLDPTGNVACFAINLEEVTFTNYGPSNYLDCYVIDQATGALSLAGTVRTRTGPGGVAWVAGSTPVSYRAKNVYASNLNSGTISQFAVGNSGALTPLSVPSVTTGVLPYAITADGSGRFIYASSANGFSSSVSQYAVLADGSLSAMTISTIASGVYPVAMASDPGGRYVYAANLGSVGYGDLSQYTIEAGGQLQAMSPDSMPTGTNPRSIAIDPSGKFLYTANQVSNDVSQFTIGSTGLLSAMTPVRVTAGSQPWSIAIDPSGQYAYVANFLGNTVSQFRMKADGSLMSIATAASGTGPVSVAVHPQGGYVYVTNLYGMSISQYKVNADGSLAALPTPEVATGHGPYSLIIEPSGRYAYVTSSGGNNIYQFIVGANGMLSPMSAPTVTSTQGPNSLTVTGTVE